VKSFHLRVTGVLGTLLLATQSLGAGETPGPAIATSATLPPAVFPLSLDRLDNGLSVVTVPTGPSGTVAFFTLVMAGSRDEVEAGKSGYAHLFEHLMFRGTKAIPPAEYEKKMQALGSDNNAFTTDDFTLYIPLIPKDSMADLIPIEADRFMHLDVAPNAYKDETGAVLGEYNKDFSNPYWALDEAMREVAFTKHTYGHTTIGFRRDVEAMPQNQAYSKTFFSRFYTPDDCVIFVVGDVDRGKVLELVKTNYGSWQGKRTPTATTPEPDQTVPRTRALTWKSPTLPRVQIGYKIPAATQVGDVAALGVLSTLVFGEPSDLYQRWVVKEQKLISLSVDPDDAIHKDASLFRIDAKIKPGAATFDEVGNAIQSALDSVARGEAKPADVEAARNHLANGMLLGLQTPTAIAERLAFMMATTGDVHGLDRYMDAVSKVTSEDVARVAKTFLVPARRTTVTLSPPVESASKPKAGAK
jgi:zinc protease